jgi:epoxyqueuosine reductase
VCPFNASSTPKPGAPELAPRPALSTLDLVALHALGAAGDRKLVRRTALRRVTRDTLARNAAVALGNTSDARAVAPLARALASHPSPLVRAHAAWALGELGTLAGGAAGALSEAKACDSDAVVREEAGLALARLNNASAALGCPA